MNSLLMVSTIRWMGLIYPLLLSLLPLTVGDFSDLLGCHALVAVPACSGTPLRVPAQQLPLQMVQDLSLIVLLFLAMLSFSPLSRFDCLSDQKHAQNCFELMLHSESTTHVKIQFYRPAMLYNPLDKPGNDM